VRTVSLTRGTRSFHASLPSGRGPLYRLRHHSKAAGGGLKRPPPAGEGCRERSFGEACCQLVRASQKTG